MIKDRFFMTGLGAGLVIGALLLALMGKAEGLATNDKSTTPLTKEQIVEQAEVLDLKVVDSSEELLTETEWTEVMVEKSGKLQGGATEEPKQSNPAVEPTNPGEPIAPAKTSSEASKTTKPTVKTPTAPAKSAGTTPTAKPKSSEVIPFRIKGGSNLTDIAKGLKKAGVITNSEQFIKEATSQKVNTKLREGSYTFSEEDTHKSIITKITTIPSR
ncbi:hypothetical protein [Paenibacillus sp. IHBB 10380]|uniref:hypothetical protein n=1 Tax=Paenibacillus sp. IHBB 10380 TaxID=1566358 RepID=UPI0005CFB5F1|nr:hypothetical protein [Paenibacillus sp. IHBB 10380]AJS59140.1 hypothetical protein UB51_12475 [Paenibacillus sp. IHBB 10380]